MRTAHALAYASAVSVWPELFVFDLDHTLINRPRFRKGPPFQRVDDGLAGVASACGATLDLYPGARSALLRCADAGCDVAIVSRSHRQAWVRDWLGMLRVDPERTVLQVVAPSSVVIRDGKKSVHVRELQRRTRVAYEDMLFFDDNAADVAEVALLGVTTVHCGDGRGLTSSHFDDGLARFIQSK